MDVLVKTRFTTYSRVHFLNVSQIIFLLLLIAACLLGVLKLYSVKKDNTAARKLIRGSLPCSPCPLAYF